MTLLSQFWRRCRHYLRRDRFDRELTEEIRLHLEMKAEEYVAAGMAPEEALWAARHQFGNETRMREMSRETWGFAMLDTLLQDVRYGARARQAQGVHGCRGHHARLSPAYPAGLALGFREVDEPSVEGEASIFRVLGTRVYINGLLIHPAI